MAAVADARVAEPLDDPPAAVARRVGEGVAQHERLATGGDPWAAPAAPAAPAAAGCARGCGGGGAPAAVVVASCGGGGGGWHSTHRSQSVWR